MENTLRIRTLPSSTHTQSVKVPPVSMASGKNFDAKREAARGMRTVFRSQELEQQKRDSSTRKHFCPPLVAESLDNDADHSSEDPAPGEDGQYALDGIGETEQQAKEPSKQPTGPGTWCSPPGSRKCK